MCRSMCQCILCKYTSNMCTWTYIQVLNHVCACRHKCAYRNECRRNELRGRPRSESHTSPSKTMTTWAFLNVCPTKACSLAGSMMNGNDELNLLFCFIIQSGRQCTVTFFDSPLIKEETNVRLAMSMRFCKMFEARLFTWSAKVFIANRLQRAANDCKHIAEKARGPLSLSCTP